MNLFAIFSTIIFFLSTNADENGSYIFRPGPIVPPTKGAVWPQPQLVQKLSDGFYTVQPSLFQFKNIGNTCQTLEEAFSRYNEIILQRNRYYKQLYFTPKTCYEKADPKFLGYLTSLQIELTGNCDDTEYPTFEMKEEYDLVLNATARKLKSDSLWGILRGLETFSQLIYLTDDHSCHRIETVYIQDYPRLGHRGLLLDTARHYHTKENIFKFLDTMSYNKFNVFHWHIVDDNSFPYASEAFPELSEKGAFHPSLMIYDQKFVSEVQDYARKRGIRVIVEFDTPGHTLSWGLGNPNLLTFCHHVPNLEWGPIDPSKNSSYTFMFKLLDEIKHVFKDNYLHLGGDEVDFACWKSNPLVNKFMEENNILEDYAALQSMYIEKIINYVDSLNLTSIVWEEVFTHATKLPKDTIINVWITNDPNLTLSKVTAAGHRVINSVYWYLDQLQTGGDWIKFYNVDPLDFPGSEEQKKLVIGAEACMWSEFVDDNNLEARVWPRASVAAEKFWSKPAAPIVGLLDSLAVASRLQEHTCRMNRRGIHAQPPSGPSVCF